MTTTQRQMENIVMQLGALTIALRHACKLSPALAAAIRESAHRAEGELLSTSLADESIEAFAAQLLIICGSGDDRS